MVEECVETLQQGLSVYSYYKKVFILIHAIAKCVLNSSYFILEFLTSVQRVILLVTLLFTEQRGYVFCSTFLLKQFIQMLPYSWYCN